MKQWTLTRLQTRLTKTGGRLIPHARRLVFQLAEVLVTREMLSGMLERIRQLRLAPGYPMAVIDRNDDISLLAPRKVGRLEEETRNGSGDSAN